MFIILKHSGGGSMAEGMQAEEVGFVDTLAEAQAVERAFYSLAASVGSWEEDETLFDIFEIPDSPEAGTDVYERMVESVKNFAEEEGE